MCGGVKANQHRATQLGGTTSNAGNPVVYYSMIIPATDNQPFIEGPCNLPAVQPTVSTLPVQKPDLSPALHIARLKPYRVTDLPDRTIYEFWKIGGDAKSMGDLCDRSNPRQCATITRHRDGTFALAFYPDDGNNQIIMRLPPSQLGAAVDDLRAAGF